MTSRAFGVEALLTPAEVAQLFRVDLKTVTRWAKAGKLISLRTLGGHRRYRESEVRNLLGQTGSASGKPTHRSNQVRDARGRNGRLGHPAHGLTHAGRRSS